MRGVRGQAERRGDAAGPSAKAAGTGAEKGEGRGGSERRGRARLPSANTPVPSSSATTAASSSSESTGSCVTRKTWWREHSRKSAIATSTPAMMSGIITESVPFDDATER